MNYYVSTILQEYTVVLMIMWMNRWKDGLSN